LGMGRAIPRERNTSTIATSTRRLLCFLCLVSLFGSFFFFTLYTITTHQTECKKSRFGRGFSLATEYYIVNITCSVLFTSCSCPVRALPSRGHLLTSSSYMHYQDTCTSYIKSCSAQREQCVAHSLSQLARVHDRDGQEAAHRLH
jgi:hypothetical protein